MSKHYQKVNSTSHFWKEAFTKRLWNKTKTVAEVLGWQEDFISLDPPLHLLNFVPAFSFWLRGGQGPTSSAVLNPGSSDTNHLQHATYVQPQQDQSHVPEVHWWQSRCDVCPGPQDWTPGSVFKKGWWWYQQGNQWLEGSEDYSETDYSEQTGPEWSGTFCLCLDHRSPQGTTKRHKETEKH